MNRFFRLCLLIAAGLSATSAWAQDADGADPGIALLKKKGIPTTPTGIIKHLNEISPTPEMVANIDKLIAQLGAESYRDRRAAQKKLEALGHLAEAKVTAATQSTDPEIRDRVARIVKSYDNFEAEEVLVACIERLAATDAGSAGVAALLKAAPLYFNPYAINAAEKALTKIARPTDLPVLLRAADDPKSSARLIAVVAAAKLLGAANADQVLKYLEDKDPKMRLATAKAIANVGDRRAIQAFLTLMEHKDVDVRQRSFYYLQQFTRAQINFPAYAKETERTASLAEWQAWAAENGKTAKLHFPLGFNINGSYLNGHTLIAMGNGGGGVVELDRKKKEVWRYPYQDCWTAEKLANGNYLIGSYSEKRLVEVTRDKKVVWEYPTKAMGAVQLANGNILVATYTSNSVIEIDKRRKKVVWQYGAGANCYKALRLRNGNTLVAGNKFIRELTPGKKVVWEYNEGNYFYSIQALANGNLWVGQYNGMAYELTRAKKRIGERKFANTTCAFRLANGNVLIAPNKGIKEMGKKGNVVWSFDGSSHGYARQ